MPVLSIFDYEAKHGCKDYSKHACSLCETLTKTQCGLLCRARGEIEVILAVYLTNVEHTRCQVLPAFWKNPIVRFIANISFWEKPSAFVCILPFCKQTNKQTNKTTTRMKVNKIKTNTHANRQNKQTNKHQIDHTHIALCRRCAVKLRRRQLVAILACQSTRECARALKHTPNKRSGELICQSEICSLNSQQSQKEILTKWWRIFVRVT